MKIGIVGVGVVGTATLLTLQTLGNEMVGYDIKPEYSGNFDKLYDCEAVILTLPTPTIDGNISLKAFDDFFEKFGGYKGVIIIKSTVLPGTCEHFSKKYNYYISHNPEFLTEENALFDSFNPHKIVIGCDYEPHLETIKKIYEPFKCEKIITNTHTSEMVKYACNCELAMQISYANELFLFCEMIGADYEAVKKAMLLDKRIGRFKNVTEERGYGGSCFPKDVQAYISQFDSKLIMATHKVNMKVKRGIKDDKSNT